MVHTMGKIRHGSIQIVILGLGFNMEISWHSIDHERSGNLTTRILSNDIQLPVLFFCFSFLVLAPIFEFGIQFQFSLCKARKCCNCPIIFVRRCLKYPLFVPLQTWKCLDGLIPTYIHMSHTIYTRNAYRHFFFIHNLCKFFPCGVKTLAPHTPRSEKINKCHLMLLQKLFKMLLGLNICHVDTIGMQLFEGFNVSLILELTCFSISSRKTNSIPQIVRLPFFNILCYVLFICSQDIPYVNRNIVAMKCKERDVKI
mmetsp:Transcript_5161/g.9816  ORF Transcript_5161/g.9816 Transcript_5161/m.9816 type:complete len:256 (+) Transcript_5161:1415-2182(+)